MAEATMALAALLVSQAPDKRERTAEAANVARLAAIDARIAEIDKRLAAETSPTMPHSPAPRRCQR